jgi:ribosome-binding protein aMBF1 (putative translation factor)
LQGGESLGLPHSRPMPSVGARCHELRIVDAGGSWRIVYRIDLDAVLILEVFRKTTQKTPKHVIDVCRHGSGTTTPREVPTMSNSKESRLKAKGWRTGTAQEFLGQSDEEAAYVELRHQLARTFRDHRKRQGLTQVGAAKLLKSSQSRVAKMEAGDATVSLDLMFRSLLKMGVSSSTLARAVGRCA